MTCCCNGSSEPGYTGDTSQSYIIWAVPGRNGSRETTLPHKFQYSQMWELWFSSLLNSRLTLIQGGTEEAFMWPSGWPKTLRPWGPLSIRKIIIPAQGMQGIQGPWLDMSRLSSCPAWLTIPVIERCPVFICENGLRLGSLCYPSTISCWECVKFCCNRLRVLSSLYLNGSECTNLMSFVFLSQNGNPFVLVFGIQQWIRHSNSLHSGWV